MLQKQINNIQKNFKLKIKKIITSNNGDAENFLNMAFIEGQFKVAFDFSEMFLLRMEQILGQINKICNNEKIKTEKNKGIVPHLESMTQKRQAFYEELKNELISKSPLKEIETAESILDFIGRYPKSSQVSQVDLLIGFYIQFYKDFKETKKNLKKISAKLDGFLKPKEKE